jgi:hypothetical protein
VTVPPFPDPPAGFRALPTIALRAAEPLYRIHAARHFPVFFNPTRDYRFNAPDGEFAVLYAALRTDGSFIETFCRTLAAQPPLITARQLDGRALSVLTPSEPLRLVDLTGPGLAALGIDNRISTSGDYALVQRWAKWFWSHPDQVHGLLYRSRHDPGEHCVALFSGRSTPAAAALANPLSTPSFAAELARLVAKYEVAIL